ncbi:helix-turn-helix domain-containing protein [Enterococcus mundtii]|uniref:helix-turn-helix domain-containing protein n=1 Tax=Enterococcus mundtii TaxID=53346 RepID=UPI0032DF7E5B
MDVVSNIFYGELDSIAEICEHYHLSESSLRRLLSQSESVLSKYELAWQTHPLDITGTEANIREYFKDFFYLGYQTPFSIMYDKELQIRGEKKFGNRLGNYEIGSGITFKEYYFILYICIQRFAIGKNIDLPNFLLQKVYKEKDFHMLCEIRSDIMDLYGLHLPLEELAWIFLSLICKRTNNDIKKEKFFFDKFNFGTDIECASEDFILRKELGDSVCPDIKIFINTFLLSRKINDLICPSANKESANFIDKVKNDYKILYQDNYEFLKKLTFISDAYITDICASLTIHFITLINLYQKKKNIYFIIEGDQFISQMLVMKAKNIIGNKHNLFFNTFSSLNKENLKSLNNVKVDLIVTNKFENYVSEYHKGIPIILVKNVPDKQDWIKILSSINCYDSHIIDSIL